MALFEKHPPRILFRAVILIGCAALLLGVTGIFYFGVPGRETPPDPANDSAVVLLGLENPARVHVQATWTADDGSGTSELGRRGLDPMTWHFTNAPEGVALTIEVYRFEGGKRSVLRQQRAVLTRGAGFQVSVDDTERAGG